MIWPCSLERIEPGRKARLRQRVARPRGGIDAVGGRPDEACRDGLACQRRGSSIIRMVAEGREAPPEITSMAVSRAPAFATRTRATRRVSR
jgi:hypothetical protein